MDYEAICRRLANICNAPLAEVKRDIAADANRAHVRPILIAQQRLRCLQKWSFQRITNAVCRDGGSLRHLPHESVNLVARAMRYTARHGGDVQEHYARLCREAQKESLGVHHV